MQIPEPYSRDEQLWPRTSSKVILPIQKTGEFQKSRFLYMGNKLKVIPLTSGDQTEHFWLQTNNKCIPQLFKRKKTLIGRVVY